MELSTQIEKQGEWDLVRFAGPIDEDAEILLAELPEKLGPQCVFNFKDVTTVNSCGVRAWINFLRDAESGRELIFDECTPEIVSQINMIPNFKGSATIRSVYAGYVCDSCGHQAMHQFSEGANLPKDLDFELEDVSCSSCGEMMEMEELEDEFFGWLEAS